ncbi:hypothetical protein BRADI_3g43743v3 [Brachypodium distachyon]|uniref:Uncharacterized protein n=1 Tax=Brachypodium distachyon TaxID=15368 RepID=A0A2K2D307_BRADI|nr:hypothetical protein BRADI_3g43743v3 [Brachypodium distachyon]
MHSYRIRYNGSRTPIPIDRLRSGLKSVRLARIWAPIRRTQANETESKAADRTKNRKQWALHLLLPKTATAAKTQWPCWYVVVARQLLTRTEHPLRGLQVCAAALSHEFFIDQTFKLEKEIARDKGICGGEDET